jgi:hypothetical protein
VITRDTQIEVARETLRLAELPAVGERSEVITLERAAPQKQVEVARETLRLAEAQRCAEPSGKVAERSAVSARKTLGCRNSSQYRAML